MNFLITDAQKWLIVVMVVLTSYVVYLLAPILTPFLVSAFLAYLGDPAVDKLQTFKLSRTCSVMVVFLLMMIIGCCFLLIVLPLLEEQFRRLIARLPDMMNWIQMVLLPWLSKRFGLSLDGIALEQFAPTLMGHWQTLGNVLSQFLIRVSASGQLILLWFSYLLLIPVVTFYLLRDWDDLVAQLATLIPRKYSKLITKLTKDCDVVLSEFLRGQFSVMSAQALFYSIGLWIVGLEFSILIGIIVGLVSFIPYLGFIVGFAIAGVTAFMQFHDFIHIVYILIVFGIGQVLEGMVLSPWLIGDRIGLHPVAVIFAVMAGAQLFGFFGMLIALPMAAMITVILRHFHTQYLDSTLYKQ